MVNLLNLIWSILPYWLKMKLICPGLEIELSWSVSSSRNCVPVSFYETVDTVNSFTGTISLVESSSTENCQQQGELSRKKQGNQYVYMHLHNRVTVSSPQYPQGGFYKSNLHHYMHHCGMVIESIPDKFARYGKLSHADTWVTSMTFVFN